MTILLYFKTSNSLSTMITQQATTNIGQPKLQNNFGAMNNKNYNIAIALFDFSVLLANEFPLLILFLYFICSFLYYFLYSCHFSYLYHYFWLFKTIAIRLPLLLRACKSGILKKKAMKKAQNKGKRLSGTTFAIT